MCSDIDSDFLWFVLSNFGYFAILPVVASAAAYGLFKFRHWGRIAGLGVCSCLLIAQLYSAIRFADMTYHYQNVPPPPIPEDAYLLS
jgi:hypothetical protein